MEAQEPGLVRHRHPGIHPEQPGERVPPAAPSACIATLPRALLLSCAALGVPAGSARSALFS